MDAEKSVTRSIMNFAFWKVYGQFDVVAATKEALTLLDRGYLFVDELIDIVKRQANFAKFKTEYANGEYFSFTEWSS